MATQVMARVRERIRSDVSVRTLFEHSTVDSLANYLVSDVQVEVKLPLVTLRRSRGQLPPLFLVHPPGGSVSCYVHVVRGMTEERAVYGIQAPGLEGDDPPLDSVVGAAALYAEKIAEMHPGGPLHLAGWSGGGHYALEVARKWRERGGEVGLVGMFDTPAARLLEEDRTEAFWTGRAPQLFADVVSEYLDSLGYPMLVTAGELAEMPPEQQIERLLDSYRGAGIPVPDALVEHARRLPAVGKATLKACWSYEPTFYDGIVTVFRASEAIGESESEEQFLADWHNAVREVNVVVVSGGHRSMVFKDIHARMLAARLEEHLT